MSRPRIEVDFNEMVAEDLVLLSRTDVRKDSAGNEIQLFVGRPVNLYVDDAGEDGRPCRLVADGRAELNEADDWSSGVKWCCRIDLRTFQHEELRTDEAESPTDSIQLEESGS